MGISETCVIERDPGTYNVVTLRALCDVGFYICTFCAILTQCMQIFALVRSSDDPQKFMIQYLCGDMRTYLSTDRSALFPFPNCHISLVLPATRCWRPCLTVCAPPAT